MENGYDLLLMSPLNIIKKNKEYRKIYYRGKSYADRYVVLYVLKNDFKICRFGFTVSKKIGNAVVRNRIKRLFKEICRLNLENIPVGFDYIIIARREIVHLNYRQIENSLLRLLKKVSLKRR
jgi:ribonuclease P protein component